MRGSAPHPGARALLQTPFTPTSRTVTVHGAGESTIYSRTTRLLRLCLPFDFPAPDCLSRSRAALCVSGGRNRCHSCRTGVPPLIASFRSIICTSGGTLPAPFLKKSIL